MTRVTIYVKATDGGRPPLARDVVRVALQIFRVCPEPVMIERARHRLEAAGHVMSPCRKDRPPLALAAIDR